jgi:Fe-S-cluster containining protein
MLNSEIDTIFFSDGYNLAAKHLEAGLNTVNLTAMSCEAYEAVDLLMDSFISRCRREGKLVDCHEGCPLCCCQAVLALPYEILFIFNFINKNLPAKELQEIRERAASRDEVTKKMTAMEFLHYKSPCPLLMNERCIAYEARPMACRTYISSSRDGCALEYDNPADLDIFPDLYGFTIRAGRMINEGICAYLTEKKIIPSEWQIESMLTTAFKTEGSFDRWLSGENAFQNRNYSDQEIMWLNNFGSGNRNPAKS